MMFNTSSIEPIGMEYVPQKPSRDQDDRMLNLINVENKPPSWICFVPSLGNS